MRRRTINLRAVVAAMVVLAGAVALADEPSTQPILPDRCLVLRSVGRWGRSPIVADPIAAQITAGTIRPPRARDTVLGVNGRESTWQQLDASQPGTFESGDLAGGYAFIQIDTPRQRVAILDAAGHSMVYVNGEPRAGDPYSTGKVRLPIELRSGSNELLFAVTRGKLSVRITELPSPVFFDSADLTAPDFVRGVPDTQPVGLVLVNASDRWLVVDLPDDSIAGGARLSIPPLSVRKIPLMARYDGSAVDELAQTWSVAGPELSTKLRIREPGQTYKRTFISEIDGSVQYYAVNPASGEDVPAKPALVLSLHGAGVEAIGQAAAYGPRNWGHIVCPTNRRPFGFDWEDQGRMDAMEVLADAARHLRTDATRTYLTGHSMGGHGTWQLAVTYPDRFAAIGPSAGWISFATYGARPTTLPATDDAIGEILKRAALQSNTLAMIRNLAPMSIYILHGSEDDNVPASQARQMMEELKPFHADVSYHEEPKAGHWWDNSPEPGASCVDWPPMFEALRRRTLPDRPSEVKEIGFTTINPAISGSCHWVTIEQQEQCMAPSTVDLRAITEAPQRVEGKTTNVVRMTVRPPVWPSELRIDGSSIHAKGPVVHLQRGPDGWREAAPAPLTAKGPHRGGPFKQAFANRMLFVYGTGGQAEENAWAMAKARFDAETFWIRGNGSVEVLSDREFDPKRNPDRNVILYGHADLNSAWDELLGDCPIRVQRGSVRIGGRSEAGDDLACLFVYPRAGSERALVGVVSGSGIAGLRLTHRLPYFVSGVAYPDLTVIGPEMLQGKARGIRCAGFFSNDWTIEAESVNWAE